MEKENTIKRIPKYKVSLVTEKALDATRRANDFYSAVYDMINAYHHESGVYDNPDEETDQRMEKEFYPIFTACDEYIHKFLHDYIDQRISNIELSEI